MFGIQLNSRGNDFAATRALIIGVNYRFLCVHGVVQILILFFCFEDSRGLKYLSKVIGLVSIADQPA